MKHGKTLTKYVLSMRKDSLSLILLLLALSNQASALESNGDRLSRLNSSPRASDEELAELRGGFTLPNGINVDFSIDRIVALNGIVTFATSFRLPETLSIVQNGLNNLAPELVSPGLGSIVQNSLDNQFISSVNTINIELSNLKNLNVNNMVFNAMVLPNLYK